MPVTRKISKFAKLLRKSRKEKKDKKEKSASKKEKDEMKFFDYEGNVKTEKEPIDYTGLMNGSLDVEKPSTKDSKDDSDT